MNTLFKVATTITCLLALVSCDQKSAGFTPEKFAKVNAPGFKTEQEIAALLGPGDVIKEANADAKPVTEPGLDAAMNQKYVESIMTDHKLPPTARFVRYRDPSQPGVFYHVVFVDGRAIETDTWDTRKKP